MHIIFIYFFNIIILQHCSYEIDFELSCILLCNTKKKRTVVYFNHWHLEKKNKNLIAVEFITLFTFYKNCYIACTSSMLF